MANNNVSSFMHFSPPFPSSPRPSCAARNLNCLASISSVWQAADVLTFLRSRLDFHCYFQEDLADAFYLGAWSRSFHRLLVCTVAHTYFYLAGYRDHRREESRTRREEKREEGEGQTGECDCASFCWSGRPWPGSAPAPKSPPSAINVTIPTW